MNTPVNRRDILRAAAIAGFGVQMGSAESNSDCGQDVQYLPVTLTQVPVPKTINFSVRYSGKPELKLAGHYWYNAAMLEAGKKCPAIVELNPYRRRDGLMYADSMMYPWFSACGYLCFRVDLQGTGDSEGIITDEYTDEELSYCAQVIQQIASLPFCDGNVGMMGKSWSAINSLMLAARDDCPSALKAIVVCCGSDDRFTDDVHYMGGAMMLDNIEWPSSMWGWVALPPDPAVVGDRWKEMWRQRIRNANFWFEMWARHQSRDSYWSETSVRDHYDKVKAPVFVLSGWQDGYKNTAEVAVRRLGGLGKPVASLLGPWGHSYPFHGYPGPRIDWLRYITEHWWDRWLKGKQPDPNSALPQFTIWLGESREPGRSTNFNEAGKWVAEDHDWMSRTREMSYYLGPDNRLLRQPAAAQHAYVSHPDILLGTAALETSSWGSCNNPDLPDDETADDHRSTYFDSDPLSEDLDCFGYPVVTLNLRCNKRHAVVAVRLCEVSPRTHKSHLVAYSFFNLCYREGNMASPQPIPAQPFSVRIPLKITGHVFKRGWVIRLSISPFLYPTMWPSSEIPTLTLRTGVADGLPQSAVTLPIRPPRAEDARLQELLRTPRTTYVDPEQYVHTTEERPGSSQRTAEPINVEGERGVLVKKFFDNGRTILGGALDNLEVDQVFEEKIQLIDSAPLSIRFTSSYVAKFARGDWKARAVTNTQLWSERTKPGETVFRYEARAQAFVDQELLEEKHVKGSIPRKWV